LKILITAANAAPAYRLKNKLNGDNIIMGDYMDLPDFMLKPGQLVRLPNPASASYTHEMLALCLDMGVELVYAFRDQEIALLQQSEVLFNEYNIKIVAGADEV
jgi:hypothetical protein